MADYPRFPMFVDLSEKRVVVVGAGQIAARRVTTLCAFCGHIEVIAPDIHPDIQALETAGRVKIVRRAYRPGDIDGADIVLAATDDASLNAEIALACRRRGILVNVTSDKALCDFYFPGVAMDGGVVIGVTAGGQDHRRARAVTERVRECLEQMKDE